MTDLEKAGAARARRHPTAVIDPRARLEDSVEVGPYTVVGPDVEVGAGCVLESFVVLEGHTVLGPDNRVGTGAVLGGEPQDVKYRGEPTRLVVGRANRIGPHVIVHRGTPGGHGVTVVGDECVLEAGSHIGHDCTVGSRVRLGAGSALAGHAVIGDDAEIGPLAGVHQFTHVGRLAHVQGHATVTMDVPPFAVVGGSPAEVVGLNREGMERAGMRPEAIEAVARAFELLYHSGLKLQEAAVRIGESLGAFEEVQELLRFLRERRRGLMR